MTKDSDLDNRRRRDYDDLQNESAGRETGRMTRFLTNPEQDPREIRKKRAEKATRQLLQTLLLDPLYRAKYAEVTTALAGAVDATERALSELDIQIGAAASALMEMEESAARLPDGTRVYRDAKGDVRRADGSIVEDTLAETILWAGDEPSFEAMTEQRQRLDKLKADKETVLTYQNDVLGPAQDMMSDPDDPPSIEEMDRILEGIETRMPRIVKDMMTPNDEAAPSPERSSAITLPTLGGTK